MKRHLRARVAGSMALLLLLAACGSDTEPEGSEETAGENETEPAEDEEPEGAEDGESEGAEDEGEAAGDGELTTVTVGFVSLHTWHWWALIAQEEGLMEPHGIDLDIVTFGGTSQIGAALLSGDAQFGSVTPEGIFPAQDQEPTMKMVAAGLSTNPYTLITAPDIETYEDLRGGTIGVSSTGSSADYFTAKLMMLENGLEEGTDYNFVDAGSPSDRVAAMTTGQIQAVLNFEPAAYVLTDEGMNVLEASADYPRLSDVEVAALVADEDWYTENREVAVDFLRGFLDAQEWLHDPANREQAVAYLAESMDVSEQHADDTYERFVVELQAWDLTGKISEERLTNTFANAAEAGVEGVPAADDLDWRYDNSLVEEAANG